MGYESSTKDAIAFAAKEMQEAGVDVKQITTWKFEQLSLFDPNNSAIYESAKQKVEATSVVQDIPLSPTEIGKLLAKQRGESKAIAARSINQYLIDSGLQYKHYRISSKTKKQKFDYRLTELGKQYGVIEATTARNSSGTVYQVRWYSCCVDFLSNWLDKQSV